MKPRTLLFVSLLLGFAACRAASSSRRFPISAFGEELLQSQARHLADVGVEGVQDTLAIIANVQAARIDVAHKQIVVLDASAPYIKIFDWNGKFVRSFLARGGGPKEAEYPVSIGLLGDSLLLVAELSGRLRTFDLMGQQIGERMVAGLAPLAVGSACGKWLIYGPKTVATGNSTRNGTETGWVHLLTLGLDSIVLSADLVSNSSNRSEIGFGKPYGLISGDEVFHIRHDDGDPPAVMSWNCSQIGATFAVTSLLADRPVRKVSDPHALQPLSGSTFPSGLASLPGGMLLSDMQTGGGHANTLLTLIERHGKRAVTLRQVYAIRDSRPGVGILFESMSEAAKLTLISEDDVMRFFQR